MTKETKVGLVVGLVFMVAVVYLLHWVTGTSEVEEQAIAYRAQQEQQSGQGLGLGSGRGIPLSVTRTTPEPVKKSSPVSALGAFGAKKDTGYKTGLTVKTPVTKKAVLPTAILPVKKASPAVVEPRFHIVKKGETLSDVAAAEYGETHRQEWRRIHEANSYKMPNPNIVWPGLKLLIPSMGKSGPLVSRKTSALVRSRTYTVVAGDTLSEISTKKLGTATRWREILALNKDKSISEYRLPVGTVLKLPAASKPTDIRLPKSASDIWRK